MSKMYNNQVQQADNGKYPIGSTICKLNRQRRGEGGAATGGHILARAMLHVGSVRSWLSPLVQEDLLQVRIAWVFSPFF